MPLINVRDKKRELRAKYKRIRRSCPPELKQRLDSELCRRFLSLDEYKSCDTLFAFVSSEIECNTGEILRTALADGKRLALPKCGERSGEMDFHFVTSLSALKPGKFGIMEPDAEICERVTDLKSGLCLVPALAFDYRGYRLGFGKGYYDRFLSGFGGDTAGICYSKCIAPELPAGEHDVPVQTVITERFINRINRIYNKG